MIKKFRTGTTYLIGAPKLSESQNRSEPVFEDKGVINISGQLLKNFGVTSVGDLATKPIQPLLKLNKMYWVYEIGSDSNLQYFGEFTVIARIPQQQTPVIIQPYYETSPGAGAMTTLSDAMQVPQNAFNEWKSKYESAEERIQTLQDSFDALRDEREGEGERINSIISTQSDEQSKLMRSQLDALNAQMERLYKIIADKDRHIFQLQQDNLDIQMKLQQQKIKTDYIRDFDRATKEIQRKAEANSQGGGLNDLLQIALQALPLLLADKPGKPQNGLSDSNNVKAAKTQASSNTPIHSEYEEAPPRTTVGAIEQPQRDQSGSYIPPRPMQMNAPRRVVIAEDQSAEVIESEQSQQAHDINVIERGAA